MTLWIFVAGHTALHWADTEYIEENDPEEFIIYIQGVTDQDNSFKCSLGGAGFCKFVLNYNR